MRDDNILVNGTVIDQNVGGFVVQLDDEKTIIKNVRLAGKMKLNKIRVILGDRVQLRLCPYDLNKGFIVYRGKC